MFKNILKSALNVAVTPIDLVTDIVNAPSDAADGKDLGTRTADRLSKAKDCLDKALDPEEK